MPFHWIFVGLWLVLAGYWLWSSFGNKRTVYRTNPVWRILATVVFVGLFLLMDQSPLFRTRFLPFHPGAEWAYVGITASGVAFAVWARRTLGRNWSGNPTLKEDHELVSTGPYRMVRHPIYTGILTAAVGTALGSGKLRETLALVLAVLFVAAKIRIEEGLMMRQFPAAYPAYRSRTKAIIPFLL